MKRRRRTYVYWDDLPPPPPRKVNRCRVLLVIDNRPLQEAAWADLAGARRRLEKATRDLHRHEETDLPTFRSWLSNTFPTLISAARELAQQVEAKSRMAHLIESESFLTGRSPGAIWREWKPHGGPPPEPPLTEREKAAWDDDQPDEADFDEEAKRIFEEAGMGGDDPFGVEFPDSGFGARRLAPTEYADARAIYRRLVQRLHPDRGGAWTPARARLWLQVQEAWSTQDGDWLARLEAEWESAADLLGPTSPVGRLRAALAEIDAARRDAERRVRVYRKDVAWRFSLQKSTSALAERIGFELKRDCARLREHLAALEETFAQWERVKSRGRKRQSAHAVWQEEMPLF